VSSAREGREGGDADIVVQPMLTLYLHARSHRLTHTYLALRPLQTPIIHHPHRTLGSIYTFFAVLRSSAWFGGTYSWTVDRACTPHSDPFWGDSGSSGPPSAGVSNQTTSVRMKFHLIQSIVFFSFMHPPANAKQTTSKDRHSLSSVSSRPN